MKGAGNLPSGGLSTHRCKASASVHHILVDDESLIRRPITAALAGSVQLTMRTVYYVVLLTRLLLLLFA